MKYTPAGLTSSIRIAGFLGYGNLDPLHSSQTSESGYSKMRKISVSAMDGVLVGRRERIHSSGIVMVNMWTRVCHLKRVTNGRSSGQPPSQSWLAAVKLHHPLCLCPCICSQFRCKSCQVHLYSRLLNLCFCRETSVSLVVSRGLRRLACYLSYDLVPSAGSGRQSGFSAFFFCSCLYSDKLSFHMYLLLVCSECWVMRPMFVILDSSKRINTLSRRVFL